MMKKKHFLIILSLLVFNLLNAQNNTDQSTTPNIGSFSDPRDGKNYYWVKIGEQIWMTENLQYLPSVVGSATGSVTDPCYYVYNYNGTDVPAAKASPYYEYYGVLYNWPAAVVVCPSGWHLPSDQEWTQMENYLANNGYNYDGTTGGRGTKIALTLVYSNAWNKSDQMGSVGNTDYPEFRNKSKFSAFPSGARANNATFFGDGSQCFWWTSTEGNSIISWNRNVKNNSTMVLRTGISKSFGFSVRCVKD